nr:hypothetical protein VDP59_012220 [Xanthomonas campestris pv. campestris]
MPQWKQQGNGMRKLLAAAIVIAALSGCAANPPLNFSVPGVGVSSKKLDAELEVADGHAGPTGRGKG